MNSIGKLFQIRPLDWVEKDGDVECHVNFNPDLNFRMRATIYVEEGKVSCHLTGEDTRRDFSEYRWMKSLEEAKAFAHSFYERMLLDLLSDVLERVDDRLTLDPRMISFRAHRDISRQMVEVEGALHFVSRASISYELEAAGVGADSRAVDRIRDSISFGVVRSLRIGKAEGRENERPLLPDDGRGVPTDPVHNRDGNEVDEQGSPEAPEA